MKRQEHLISNQIHTQKFQIYKSFKLDSISFLQILQSSLKIDFIQEEINWIDILSIRPMDKDNQHQILVKVQLSLFIKRKKWLRETMRYNQLINFYVMPQQIDKLILKVRRLMTQSEIDEPKFLIFFNPISGSNSQQKLKKSIQFIEKTHFKYKLISTQYKGYCQQYLKQHKPTHHQFWGVAVISGDGLVHQYINSKIDLPLIHIPAGSGNGLAKCQSVFSNQHLSVQQNLFIAMKNQVINIPAMEIQLQKASKKIYSTLNVQWALLADLDFQSQFLRCFGIFRFQLLAAWRYIFLRTYRAKISFSQTSIDLPHINQPIIDSSFETYQTNLYNFMLMIKPYIAQKFNVAPNLTLDTDIMDLQVITDSTSRFQFLKYLLSFQKGQHFNKQDKKPIYNFNYNLIKSFRLQPLGERIGVLGIDGQQYQGQKIQGRILPNLIKLFVLK